jgi:hypothetical protein
MVWGGDEGMVWGGGCGYGVGRWMRVWCGEGDEGMV